MVSILCVIIESNWRVEYMKDCRLLIILTTTIKIVIFFHFYVMPFFETIWSGLAWRWGSVIICLATNSMRQALASTGWCWWALFRPHEACWQKEPFLSIMDPHCLEFCKGFKDLGWVSTVASVLWRLPLVLCKALTESEGKTKWPSRDEHETLISSLWCEALAHQNVQLHFHGWKSTSRQAFFSDTVSH